MSTSTINPRDRLIFALDVPDATAARQLVEQLGDAVTFYKVGLELMAAGGYFELVEWLLKRNKKVFADLGIPQMDKDHDRAMVCGSLAFNVDVKAVLEGFGLREGANSEPQEYVVEKAFVGDGI